MGLPSLLSVSHSIKFAPPRREKDKMDPHTLLLAHCGGPHAFTNVLHIGALAVVVPTSTTFLEQLPHTTSETGNAKYPDGTSKHGHDENARAIA